MFLSREPSHFFRDSVIDLFLVLRQRPEGADALTSEFALTD